MVKGAAEIDVMPMETITSTPETRLPVRSAAFILSALLAAFVLLLAARGFLVPGPAAAGFGLPLGSPVDEAWLHVKGGRDLAVFLTLAAFLALRDRRGLLVVTAASMAIPLNDGLQVWLDPRGTLAFASAVHGSAFAYGIVLLAVLHRARRPRAA
jgi:hypothetical protein